MERCGKPIFSLIFNDPAWQDLGYIILNGDNDMQATRPTSASQPQEFFHQEPHVDATETPLSLVPIQQSRSIESTESISWQRYLVQLSYSATHALMPPDNVFVNTIVKRHGKLWESTAQAIEALATKKFFQPTFNEQNYIVIFSKPNVTKEEKEELRNQIFNLRKPENASWQWIDITSGEEDPKFLFQPQRSTINGGYGVLDATYADGLYAFGSTLVSRIHK